MKSFVCRSAFLVIMMVFMVSGCKDNVPHGFAGSGVLEATTVTISSLSTGTVLTYTKDEGDPVKKGELLHDGSCAAP